VGPVKDSFSDISENSLRLRIVVRNLSEFERARL